MHELLCVTAVSCSQLEADMIDWNVASLSNCTLVRACVCVCVCVCVYQTINVFSLTSDAGCCGMLLSCQTDCCTHTHTHTDQSLTYTHTRGQCVCCSGRGDTCVTVKRQNICLGNLDVSHCTHMHRHTHLQTHGLIYPQFSVFGLFTNFFSQQPQWLNELNCHKPANLKEDCFFACLCKGKLICSFHKILSEIKSELAPSYNNGFGLLLTIDTIHVSLSLRQGLRYEVRGQVATKDSKELKWWNISSSN